MSTNRHPEHEFEETPAQRVDRLADSFGSEIEKFAAEDVSDLSAVEANAIRLELLLGRVQALDEAFERSGKSEVDFIEDRIQQSGQNYRQAEINRHKSPRYPRQTKERRAWLNDKQQSIGENSAAGNLGAWRWANRPGNREVFQTMVQHYSDLTVELRHRQSRQAA